MWSWVEICPRSDSVSHAAHSLFNGMEADRFPLCRCYRTHSFQMTSVYLATFLVDPAALSLPLTGEFVEENIPSSNLLFWLRRCLQLLFQNKSCYKIHSLTMEECCWWKEFLCKPPRFEGGYISFSERRLSKME